MKKNHKTNKNITHGILKTFIHNIALKILNINIEKLGNSSVGTILLYKHEDLGLTPRPHVKKLK